MSTPDPRTERAQLDKWLLQTNRYPGTVTAGEAAQHLYDAAAKANDALTTEAARVRAETWREAAKQVAFYNCDHNHGVAATKACDDLEDQFLRQASNPTATTQPTWSTARPTREGWYWWRNPQAKYEEDREPTIYKVRLYGGELAISNCHIKDSHFERGEWCHIARPGEEG